MEPTWLGFFATSVRRRATREETAFEKREPSCCLGPDRGPHVPAICVRFVNYWTGARAGAELPSERQEMLVLKPDQIRTDFEAIFARAASVSGVPGSLQLCQRSSSQEKRARRLRCQGAEGPPLELLVHQTVTVVVAANTRSRSHTRRTPFKSFASALKVGCLCEFERRPKQRTSEEQTAIMMLLTTTRTAARVNRIRW